MPIWSLCLIRGRPGSFHGYLSATTFLRKPYLSCSHDDNSGHYAVNIPDIHGLLGKVIVILEWYVHSPIGTYIAFLFSGSDMDETKEHIIRFNQGLRNRGRSLRWSYVSHAK